MSYQEQTTAGQGTGVDESLLTRSVFETLTRDENLRTLTRALEIGGFRGILEGSGVFTVFAVPEEAQDRMAAPLREAIAENRTADIRRWVARHVAKGKQLEADLKTLTHLATMEGEALPVSHKDGQVQVNGFRIIKGDIACTNGVIHIVDWTADR
jgi:transforming growth factor-beta-induced protein